MQSVNGFDNPPLLYYSILIRFQRQSGSLVKKLICEIGGKEQGTTMVMLSYFGSYYKPLSENAPILNTGQLLCHCAGLGLNVIAHFGRFEHNHKMPLPSFTHLNLRALCREGQLKEALHILLTTYNPPEDYPTYLQLLQSCILKNSLSQGKNVHSFIAHRRFAFTTSKTFPHKLIYMYAKCGTLKDARKVFDNMQERNSYSWNTLIAAYRRHGLTHEVVTLFHHMQQTGFQPDRFTFASVLPACAKMGALEQGINIHRGIMERGILSDIVVATALADMYAKCGSIDKARYTQNGSDEKALETFKQMKLAGVKPDYATFASILPACAKMKDLEQGLVDDGCAYFNHMSNHYCITPRIDHYVCMADLLARAGYLEDTLSFIIKMPVKPVVDVWLCFLAACRSHMNIGLGVFTATLLFDLDPKNAAAYVLLSNIYAEVGRWGERSYPQTQEIYAKLDKLAWEIKAAG
ncbi:pentatricopeptide repeat-containing protein DOT4, chloroplastic-like [Cryptomeria japonica]|uniref:pentatricopeptide repeat-containing protein DOT4, chloroplastic-like n=1 Tax=Cryptomeria japonica TaxID=3369 RepID=UPI0027DA35F5|nr:pentatricopeptide repeat-containing protein DOT4, chloroplastic-like [Cryptomeria japonica]